MAVRCSKRSWAFGREERAIRGGPEQAGATALPDGPPRRRGAYPGRGDVLEVASQLVAMLQNGPWKANAPMTELEEFILAEFISNLSLSSLVACNEPMAKRTTLRVGGCAQFYIEPVR